MRYLPLTNADREAMLADIGVGHIDELFADIPEKARLKDLLDLPKAATRLGIDPAGLAPAPHQVDGKRHRCIEVRGSFVTGVPGFDIGHHTFTQVVRQRMRHGKSPPHTLNHLQTDL